MFGSLFVCFSLFPSLEIAIWATQQLMINHSGIVSTSINVIARSLNVNKG
ncbi:hypothetical protein PCIT_a0091 [Pseudoalteromonas citrea]|uniref:Uncharacterized protein n=1 Tax=Pseudoalteromonas citrea TaxID=43655 RepID=A0AAD4AK21_9GAMM|nr:hypothetical protein PCIT_a0091 [Pseudoalteromonas citrea]